MNSNQGLNNTLTYFENNNQFSDLFNLEEIQRLQDLFADCNGVASIITRPDGTPITRPSKFTRFCNDIIRGTEKGCLNCYKSGQEIGRYHPDGPVTQLCHSGGLWDAGSGISVGGKHIANWIIGQVRNEEVDEQQMNQQAHEIGANAEAFIKAYKEVPVMSVDQFKKVSDLLFEFTNNLSEKATNNLQLKVQIAEQKETIALLRESKNNLQYIVKHDPNAIAVYNCKLHYMAVSERYVKDYNIKEGDIIGKHHDEVFPDMPQQLKDVHQRCLAGAIESNNDDCFERPDGSITLKHWECRPWYKLNGKIGGIITYAQVTMGRKKAEEALLESEIKYRAFFENSMDATLLTSPDGKTLAVNQAACSMFGYSEDELIRLGRSGIEDATDDRLSVLLTERKLKGKALGEVIFIRKNGTRFSAEISTSVFKNKEGFDRASIIIRDISERKKIHHEIKFQTDLLNNVGQAVIATDIKNNVTYWNNAAEKIYGWSSQEAIGQNIINLTPTEATEEQYDEIIKEISEGHTWSGEFLIKRKDGTNFPAYVTDAPILDPEGKLTGVIGISSDITERKLAEEALQMSEQQFRSLYENSKIGLYRTTFDGKIILANPSLVKMIGYSSFKEIAARNLEKDGFEANYERRKFLEKIEINGEINGLKSKWTKKDGTSIDVIESAKAIRDPSGKTLYYDGSVEDITERKQTEELLIKLSSAIEQTVDTVAITDCNGSIEYVNHAFEVLTGYTFKEAIGQNHRILKSGKSDQKSYELMWKTILSGKVYRQEIVNRKKNGDLFEEEKTISPIFDKNNIITHFVGTGVNITARKLAEKELIKAKERAEESDRLKSAFLSNMSHEVRTPLNSIIGFSQLLTDRNFEEEQRNEFLQIIINNGNNLLTIISDIMDISKLESGEITIRQTQIDAQKFLSGIYEQFSFQAEANKLELKLTLPDSGDTETVFMADDNRLRQIFNNLMNNAFKFTENGRIEIGYHLYSKFVEFYVSDTGIGVPAAYHYKIFESFRQIETEKTRKYGGNGLGLAITKNLVELMGGKIWVVSEFGKGSVFYFTMPINH